MVVIAGIAIGAAVVGFRIGAALVSNYLANEILAEHENEPDDDTPDLQSSSEGGPAIHCIGKECRVRGQLLWMSHIYEDGDDQVVNVAVALSRNRIESVRRVYAEGYEIHNGDGTITVGPIADVIGIDSYRYLGEWVAFINSTDADYDLTKFRPQMHETISMTGFSDSGNLWGSGGGTAGNEKGVANSVSQEDDGTTQMRAWRKYSTSSPTSNVAEPASPTKTITITQVIPADNPDFVTETTVYRGDPGQVWSSVIDEYEGSTVGEGTPLIDDGSVSITDTVVHMDGFTTKPEAGDRFCVAGDSTFYTVVSSTALVGTDTDVTFTPGAVVAWSDNDVVTLMLTIPAYEQTAYVTLEALILTQFGNRVPKLTAIVEQDDDDVTIEDAIDMILGWAGWTNDSDSDLYWDASACDADKIVEGYTMKGSASPFTRLEPLRIAFDVVAQCRDGVVHFFHPEDARIWAIDEGEFGAGENTSSAPGLDVSPDSEASLPSHVTVRFIDAGRDWEDAAVDEHRTFPNVLSEDTLEIDLSAMVMTYEEARAIAYRMLWQPWQRRRKVIGTLPPRFLHVLENDVVETTYDGETARILVERMDRGANGLLELRGSLIETLL